MWQIWLTIWNNGIVNPMTNLLLLLYDLLGNNFFLALTVFTVLVRLIMLPLNLRQQRGMARQQEMQPQIQAIQKKYRDNPQKMQEEFAKIGYNPAETLSSCLPLFLQMPIFFGLYRAIIYVLAATPQGLFELAERAYDFIDLTALLPVDNSVLWFNLAQPDPLFVLPILVAASMYLQQKLMTPQVPKDKKQSVEDNPAASIQQSMQVTMPLMFGFISLNFPAGLSIYFVVSNLIGIVQGYILRRNKEQIASENESKKKAKPAPEMSSADKHLEAATEPTVNAVTETAKVKEYVPPAQRKQSKRKKRK